MVPSRNKEALATLRGYVAGKEDHLLTIEEDVGTEDGEIASSSSDRKQGPKESKILSWESLGTSITSYLLLGEVG